MSSCWRPASAGASPDGCPQAAYRSSPRVGQPGSERTAPGPGTERRQVVEALAAADGGAVVPAAVRVEAGWDRRAALAAPANRLVPDDDHLDRPGADRAAELRASVPGASVVDACVAVAAERAAADGGPVEILTSDGGDMGALATRAPGTFRRPPALAVRGEHPPRFGRRRTLAPGLARDAAAVLQCWLPLMQGTPSSPTSRDPAGFG